MYPIEYICTREETTNTGINIDTVRESKVKLHNTFNDSESTHLKSCTDTEVLFIPTSLNDNTEITVVITRDEHVIS